MGFLLRFPSLDNSFVDRKEFYYKYYWTISYLLQNVTTVKPAPAPLKLLKVEQNCSLQYLPKKARAHRDGICFYQCSYMYFSKLRLFPPTYLTNRWLILIKAKTRKVKEMMDLQN